MLSSKSLFSYRRRTVGQKLDLATSLRLQIIFNKYKTQLKVLTHKAAVIPQIMVLFDLWFVICTESYSQSKLVRFWPTLYIVAQKGAVYI